MLEEREMPGYVEYEEILETYNPIDIALIKSLLDPERIEYFFRDEYFGYMQPWAQPARLMVRAEHAFEAREILRDLRLSYSVSSGVVKPKDPPGESRGRVLRFPDSGEPERDAAPGTRRGKG
jgi:hypothetical protein